ncbi:glycosyltransferase [Parasphingopyxis marina]|uniref:Glycosyltransferase n=1 Tax=Parasphingopyxis marina TaxID=2761622 RepID=A0A842HSH5_9SPHN|nr:glycosyltransferase [Parasphingopyxis marina]MBC2776026.1 glycosyltransferase [Parasphingopyxis marina]
MRMGEITPGSSRTVEPRSLLARLKAFWGANLRWRRAGRYRLNHEGETFLGLELCVGDASFSFALDDAIARAAAGRWQIDPHENTLDFAMRPGERRLLRARNPLDLSTLTGEGEQPAFLVFDLFDDFGDLHPECAVVIRVYAKSAAEPQSYRIGLKRPRPVVIMLPPDFSHLNLGVRLAGSGKLAPLQLCMGVPSSFSAIGPKMRSDIRARIQKLQRGDGFAWHDHLDPGQRAHAMAATLASQSQVISARLQDTAKHLAIVRRQADELAAELAGSRDDHLDEFAKFYEAIDEGLNTLTLSQMRMARARASLTPLLGCDAAEDKSLVQVPKYSRVTSSPSWRREIALEAAKSMRKIGLFGALTNLWRQVEFVEFKIILVELAEILSEDDPAMAHQCLVLSLGLDPQAKRAHYASAKLFKWGALTSAGRLLEDAKGEEVTRFIGELRLALHLRATAQRLIPPKAGPQMQKSVSVAYVASSSQPWSVAGYAIRTQEMLTTMMRRDVDISCFTRPGFPWDRPDIVSDPDALESEQLQVGDVTYLHCQTPFVEADPENYMQNAARILGDRIKAEGRTIVHAASNYRNGLPALIAARSLGLPFIYEVRGLWELTAASRRRGWEATERFDYERQIERLIVREADLVFTITVAVRDELLAGFDEGEVDAGRFELLSNAIDPGAFEPAERDEKLAAKIGIEPQDFVLVYAGSLLEYEGLDDVIEAVGLLRQRNIPAKLVVVGAGRAADELKSQAKDLVACGAVTFQGKVKPDKIRSYLSLADAVPIVRKPFRVCELVSPLKPFEAMSMEKAVIVSDLRALREIVEDGVTGRICRPGDPLDLARVVEELYENPEASIAMGKAARRWVIKNHSWDHHAKRLEAAYASFVA